MAHDHTLPQFGIFDTLPQFGMFARGTHAHHFLEFDLWPGVTAADAVDAFRRLRTPDVSTGGVNVVITLGADAWCEVAPWAAPADVAWFTPIAGADARRAPAAQHDAWLWLSGAEPDVTWQSARRCAGGQLSGARRRAAGLHLISHGPLTSPASRQPGDGVTVSPTSRVP